MARCPSKMRRTWRIAPWSRNPLMRPLDRLEGVLRLVALLAVLAAIPLAMIVGNAVSRAAAARIAGENAAEIPVAATIVSTPVPIPDHNGVPTQPPQANVQWKTHDHNGSATLEVPGTAKLGDQVTIWLDPAGHRTSGPRPLRESGAQGVNAAVGVALSIGCGAALLVWGTALTLGRRRSAEWEREWRHLGPGIGQSR